MAVIHLTTRIKADSSTVFDLSRSIDLHKISTEHTDETAIAGVTSGLISLGETVTWKAKHFGFYFNLTSKITEYKRPKRFIDEMTKGPFGMMRHVHLFTQEDDEVVMTDEFEFRSPLGILGSLVDKLILTDYMTKFLIDRNEVIKKFAENTELSASVLKR